MANAYSSWRMLPAARVLVEAGTQKTEMAVRAPISTKISATGLVRREEPEPTYHTHCPGGRWGKTLLVEGGFRSALSDDGQAVPPLHYMSHPRDDPLPPIPKPKKFPTASGTARSTAQSEWTRSHGKLGTSDE